MILINEKRTGFERIGPNKTFEILDYVILAYASNQGARFDRSYKF